MLLLLLGSTVSYADDRMKIRAPDVAENGNVVPVSVKLFSPMFPGQTLKIFSNGELATSVRTVGLSITTFSTRVRMFGSGAIEVRLADQNDQVVLNARKAVQINIAATVPESGNPKTNVRKRVRGKTLKSLFTNKMAAFGHIRQVDFHSAIGVLTVHATPLMSSKSISCLYCDPGPGECGSYNQVILKITTEKILPPRQQLRSIQYRAAKF